MEIDPQVVTQAAGEVLTCSVELATGWVEAAVGVATIASHECGPTPSAAEFAAAATGCGSAAGSALENLVASLEYASEALSANAFGHVATDEQTAERMKVL